MMSANAFQGKAAQKYLVNIAAQVAHDIRSPLASLLMILKSCQEIPEDKRNALEKTANSIEEIANSLLGRYCDQNKARNEVPKSVALCPLILELITAKHYEYQDRPISFHHEFTQAATDTTVCINPIDFKRALSNVVNNAVDAFGQKGGKVVIKASADDNQVKIEVIDNGLGIPKAVLEKIQQNRAVTSGKANGHGIGLSQVREMVAKYQGKFSISSEVGVGTIVSLRFSQII